MRKVILFILAATLGALLAYTRFAYLDWGLPYPFHPDERNMAVALQQLQCTLEVTHFNLDTCFNPHFFAYGQFPLYLGYILLQGFHFIRDGSMISPITFLEATVILRIIAALSSVATVVVATLLLEKIAIINLFSVKKSLIRLTGVLALIFSPVLIQMAHFGTTESLLTFLYILNIYIAFLALTAPLRTRTYILCSALCCGIAIATKISSVLFLAIPVMVLLTQWRRVGLFQAIFRTVLLSSMTVVFAILFSPHNIISFGDFLSSLQYESAVGLGSIDVFYTKQFFQTDSILFQLFTILPYSLGLPVLVMGVLGFFFLPNTKTMNLIRCAVIVSFVPNAFLYAKWTRFIAPTFPLIIMLAVLFLIYITHRLKIKHTVFITLMAFFFCVSGVSFFSIYKGEDTRFQASQWMYENIPSGSYVLSETANVIDLPIHSPQDIQQGTQKQFFSTVIPFNFYDLDANPSLQDELAHHLEQADYIIIPSRRIFHNYTCLNADGSIQLGNDRKCDALEKQYPHLQKYYQSLFGRNSEFELIQEFESFPRLSFFGKEFVFNDEDAEETWTVFDHPVIRIYKRVSS